MFCFCLLLQPYEHLLTLALSLRRHCHTFKAQVRKPPTMGSWRHAALLLATSLLVAAGSNPPRPAGTCLGYWGMSRVDWRHCKQLLLVLTSLQASASCLGLKLLFLSYQPSMCSVLLPQAAGLKRRRAGTSCKTIALGSQCTSIVDARARLRRRQR